MKETDRNSLIALPIIILAGLGIALAGSQGGAAAFGIPIFALSVGLVFLIQWLAFVAAYLLQTEKFYDLTGSMTYISVTTLAVLLDVPGVIRGEYLVQIRIDVFHHVVTGRQHHHHSSGEPPGLFRRDVGAGTSPAAHLAFGSLYIRGSRYFRIDARPWNICERMVASLPSRISAISR